MNDMAVDVGESAVDAVLADGELLVIDSHEVEDSGVEIVAVGGALSSLKGEVILSLIHISEPTRRP